MSAPTGRTKAEMQDKFSGILADLADHVPAGIELMFHFCYGDSNHRHVVEPTDMADMVELANRLTKHSRGRSTSSTCRCRATAPTTPISRRSRGCKLAPRTELCLGLVHYTDGVAGTRRGSPPPRDTSENFSIATECGFGRRPPQTIPELLRIHAQVAGRVAR